MIAAVKGYAIGGGNHLAYMCDFTICADNAVFGQTGPRVGSPAPATVVAYLTRVVGAKKAREIWLLCRQYTAQEALEMGLINKVVPIDRLEEEVDLWCEEILKLSPTIIEIHKAAFDTFDVYPYYKGSGVIGRRMAPYVWDSEEVKEAQTAFFEKREPSFWKDRMR